MEARLRYAPYTHLEHTKMLSGKLKIQIPHRRDSERRPRPVLPELACRGGAIRRTAAASRCRGQRERTRTAAVRRIVHPCQATPWLLT